MMQSDLKNPAVVKQGWGSGEGVAGTEAERLVGIVAVVVEAWTEEGEVKVIRSASILHIF